ncbi:hypothetical protein MACH26_33990 [Planctobacterium marinum]|uniref:Solute-binding protein family 3/N-terminal domain-containing protein n=1 Tax=Planctobacterium marinum TaxID=1631968 RepID=A0AA48KRS2_9ALTE|nr:hypothetical protein MACH26_33990 [Planctobacterium marinum]
MLKSCLTFVVITAFCFPLAAKDATSTLTMCIDHYPPLQVVLPNGAATGANVEVTRQFMQHLGYKLDFTADTPFKRCLQLLKEGEVDLMAGLLDSEQRQQDYHMFLYDDHTVKAFFINNNVDDITHFSDLAGLNIGVVQGTRQFEQFDEADSTFFTRTYTDSLPIAFEMLAKGEVDAVVSTDYYGKNILARHPEYRETIRQSSYKVIDGTKVYIALSRQSEYAVDASRMNQKAIEMFLSGEFETLTIEFQKNHHGLY